MAAPNRILTYLCTECTFFRRHIPCGMRVRKILLDNIDGIIFSSHLCPHILPRAFFFPEKMPDFATTQAGRSRSTRKPGCPLLITTARSVEGRPRHR